MGVVSRVLDALFLGFDHFCGGLEAVSVFFVGCWDFSTSFSMTSEASPDFSGLFGGF